MKASTKNAWPCAVIALALVTSWQWATVAANYNGNWTALFCTGALQPSPPLVAAEHVYLFPNSTGYDGQFYHYMAHDPWMRTPLQSFVDNPALRWRRILMPLLAYGLALGRDEWIDRAYEFVFLLAIALGVYWSCCVALQFGLPVASGLLFLAIPAVPISMDRLLVDIGLATLAAAFVYYSRAPSWRLFGILACAALTRETGFLLIASYCVYLLLGREFRTAGIFALSAAPAVAWYSYVHARAGGSPYPLSLVPFSAILRALANPFPYPAGTPLIAAVQVADYVALAGILLALAFAFYCGFRRPYDPPRLAALAFAFMGLALQRADLWDNVYGFGRVLAPLLICLGAVAAQRRSPWLLAPIAMMLPRIAIQLTPQFLGIVRWIA